MDGCGIVAKPDSAPEMERFPIPRVRHPGSERPPQHRLVLKREVRLRVAELGLEAARERVPPSDTARLRSLPTDSGIALDVIGNWRYDRRVLSAVCVPDDCTPSLQPVAEVTTAPSVLAVNNDNMDRASATALA